MNIYLRNCYYQQQTMSDHAFAVYFALRQLHRKSQLLYCVGKHELYFSLTGELMFTRHMGIQLEDGISELGQIGIIQIIDKQNGHWLLDLTGLYFDYSELQKSGDTYVVINLEDAQTIFHSSKHPFRLLRFYCYLCSTMRSDLGASELKYGCKSKSRMAHELNLHQRTIAGYIEKLEMLNLVFVHRSNCLIPSGSSFANLPNIYGLHYDKKRLEQLGRERDDYHAEAIMKNQKANLFRSASARYAAFVNGYKYPETELEQIYKTLIEYNCRQQDPERRKDLTVFAGYPFYTRRDKDGVK